MTKPVSMGMRKSCQKHKEFIQECPRCRQQVEIIRHTDNDRKRHIDVPVTRVKYVYKGKIYGQSGKVQQTNEGKMSQEDRDNGIGRP